MPSNVLKILFFGDVVGPLGRLALKEYLELHRKQDGVDFVIANGENTTHGRGLSVKHYQDLIRLGVDCVTSGNHFFNTPEAVRCIKDYPLSLRPYNLDESVPGVGTKVFDIGGVPVRVTNLLGRVFLPMTQRNPFYCLDDIFKMDEEPIIHIVDFHAEATAEKRCLAEYADGKITALIGTHTHVQTNDPKLLNQGTFFLTDAGMNGAYDAVLGDEKNASIYKTMTGIPTSQDVPRKGKLLINGVSLEIDVATRRVVHYQLINETREGDA